MVKENKTTRNSTKGLWASLAETMKSGDSNAKKGAAIVIVGLIVVGGIHVIGEIAKSIQ